MDGLDKILTYNEQVDRYNKEMFNACEAYRKMINLMIELETTVRRACIAYMRKDENGKHSLDKIEMLAVKDDKSLEADYHTLIGYRMKEKALRRVIQGIGQGLSSVQSQMKYDAPINTGGYK